MVTLENIEQHIIPFDQFRYKWRFTEEKYNVLPPHHLEQIRPLGKEAAHLLVDVTVGNGNFDKWPLGNPSFRHVEQTQILDTPEDEQLIKKWLFHRGLPFEREVFASWDYDSAAITTWKMVVKYWSDFAYPFDDLIVVDKNLNWALLFYHESIIVFGTNVERSTRVCENELVGTGSI